jgi:hypothetical protein
MKRKPIIYMWSYILINGEHDMKLEVKDFIGAKKAIIFVINNNNKIYQIHKVEFKWNKNPSKVIDINDNDIVAEYTLKYDKGTNKFLHLLYIIYHPKTMNEDEAFNRAKVVIGKYLESQIAMGVNLHKLVGG